MEIEVKKEFMNVDDKSFKITTVEEKKYQFGIQYQFDIGYAQKYGVEEAIFLQNIIFWIRQNKSNEKNFHNNRYWTYNTQKSYTTLFPFWSEFQIKRIIKSLIDQNVIIVSHFNTSKCDHTNWYALQNESMLISPITEETKSSNQTDEIVQTNRRNRPFINTDSKPDSKQHIYSDILNYWNNKNIIEHNLSVFEKSLSKNKMKDILSLYKVSDILKAIDNYNIVIKDQATYFFSYKWSLWEFLSRGLPKFIDASDPLNNFKRNKVNMKKESRYHSEADL